VPWDALGDLPEWFVVGMLLATASAVLVAVAFVAGQRAFARTDRERRDDRRGYSGAERRFAEIRHYLQAIDERYAEEATVDGEAVEFYLPERDVAVTFDARVFFNLQTTDTEVVLIEDELPGAALGSRLPFETPDLNLGDENGSDDDGRSSGVVASFAALGLPATADVEDVKRAYRQRVKEVHPDHGGDEAEFKRIREAYDTAREHAD
jgi:hypothetical protein